MACIDLSFLVFASSLAHCVLPLGASRFLMEISPEDHAVTHREKQVPSIRRRRSETSTW